MFECRWGVVCWGNAAEDLARGTVHTYSQGPTMGVPRCKRNINGSMECTLIDQSSICSVTVEV